jgi:pimeloyl-ACP methyl ester carboxylesterase
MAGRGPLLVLVHGIAGSSATWQPIAGMLSANFTVLAPDLPGHGGTEAPAGDYTLAGAADMVRDLLILLGRRRATFVGHSLGGGVVMQLSYQFPEIVERLVLESSGGLGAEVSPLLRALSLPGAEYVMPLGYTTQWLRFSEGVWSRLGSLGLKAPPGAREMWQSYLDLADPGARRSFLATLRGVVGPSGQRVSARDRLYLASQVPTLIVWGEGDRVIPASHGREAAAQLPGSQLVMLSGVGHFPHAERPSVVAGAIKRFVAETEPAHLRRDEVRKLLQRGA